MRLFTLDELAERWTIAHTVAVAAWVVVLVLGLVLLFKNDASTYPQTEELKVYAGENATFRYPANWIISSCEAGRPFIELPGDIRAEYKGQHDYPLALYGTGVYNCEPGRPERFDISSEQVAASDNPCAPATSTRGEMLANGLYLQLQEQGKKVFAVQIKQNSCFASPSTVVLGFAFADPKAGKEGNGDAGPPAVDKGVFLASPQYKDIKALAESIKY